MQKEENILIETLRGIDIAGNLRAVCAKGKLSILIPYETHTCCVYDKGDKGPEWHPPCQTCFIREKYKYIHALSYVAWKGWLVTHKEISSHATK